MIINQSKAYKKFKKQIGQANHFLITILVGLDALQNNDEIDISDDFSTSWNPKNRDNSINRSREFARKASLSWVIDCLDSYLQCCNVTPKLISNMELIKKFDEAGHSVYKKYIALINTFSADPVISAFVELAISWRNNLIHSNANNPIDKNRRKVLLDNAEYIQNNFCNLNINIMLNNFDNKGTPTFKEVTSLIKATIDFVAEVDKLLISNIDTTKYLNDIFNYFLNLQEDRNFFLAKLHNCSSNKQIQKVENIMKQFGILSIDKCKIEDLLKSF